MTPRRAGSWSPGGRVRTPRSTDTQGCRAGTAIANSTPTVNVNGHVLTITPAALTVDLTTDATKVYGTNDPAVTATTPSFTGRVNTTVTDWNGTPTLIDDTAAGDRKSTRLNSSHLGISYAVFCLKKIIVL